MKPKRKPDYKKLAEEARKWDSREISPAGWRDAPEAIPRRRGKKPPNKDKECEEDSNE